MHNQLRKHEGVHGADISEAQTWLNHYTGITKTEIKTISKTQASKRIEV